jgi:hypothetical protein
MVPAGESRTVDGITMVEVCTTVTNHACERGIQGRCQVPL